MTWQKLGTETLTGTSDEINILEFAAATFLFVLTNAIDSGVIGLRTRVGTTTIDTGDNYARRLSNNGGTDSTATGSGFVDFASFDQAVPNFQIVYGINISGEEKLFIAFSMNGQASGAGTAPQRTEAVGKWVNTAAQLQSWRSYNASTGDFATDSNLSVLGSDIAPEILGFASLYESFQELTSIQVSHFVEWFSGDDLDSIWTKNTGFGSPTYAMEDAIDGGFKITTGSSGNNRGGINFNSKRHYAHDGSIMIAVWKSAESTEDQHLVGFSSNNDIPLGLADSALSIIENGFSDFKLQTSASGTATRTATDIAIDTAWHTHKVELTASDCDYYIDGVLKVTNTTNLPAIAMQPYIDVRNNNAAVNGISIRYFEAFNTSVTILSSLYERLSALTQVMGQRVVETFSGALLNERWTTRGGGTLAMADTVDGGFEILNPNSANSDSRIDFNNKRQYDFDDSVIIYVMKSDSDSNFTRAVGGFENIDISLINAALAGIDTGVSATKFFLGTGDNSSSSATTASLDNDTAVHVYKIENGSADIKLTMDGVLEVTKTTNRPTLKLQPFAEGQSFDSTGARTLNLRYLEAYNKLTTEADFPSIYELFNPLTTVARQHFWEWFDGNSLHNRWNETNLLSAGATTVVDDTVDGGITMITNGASIGSINFNNKRQYASDASIIIFVEKQDATAYDAGVGFSNNTTGVGGTQQASFHWNNTNTFMKAQSADGFASEIDTSINNDLLEHSFKLELGSADIKYTIDGVLEVTKTTNRPTTSQQPIAAMSSSNGNGVMHIRYIEAFNT